MDPKTVRPRARDVQTRFFQAVDMLIGSGKIKSLNAFCNEFGLHRPKYSNLRTATYDSERPGTGYKFIDIDALSYLVTDYRVSADWLLSGRGGMFR